MTSKVLLAAASLLVFSNPTFAQYVTSVDNRTTPVLMNGTAADPVVDPNLLPNPGDNSEGDIPLPSDPILLPNPGDNSEVGPPLYEPPVVIGGGDTETLPDADPLDGTDPVTGSDEPDADPINLDSSDKCASLSNLCASTESFTEIVSCYEENTEDLSDKCIDMLNSMSSGLYGSCQYEIYSMCLDVDKHSYIYECLDSHYSSLSEQCKAEMDVYQAAPEAPCSSEALLLCSSYTSFHDIMLCLSDSYESNPSSSFSATCSVVMDGYLNCAADFTVSSAKSEKRLTSDESDRSVISLQRIQKQMLGITKPSNGGGKVNVRRRLEKRGPDGKSKPNPKPKPGPEDGAGEGSHHASIPCWAPNDSLIGHQGRGGYGNYDEQNKMAFEDEGPPTSHVAWEIGIMAVLILVCIGFCGFSAWENRAAAKIESTNSNGYFRAPTIQSTTNTWDEDSSHQNNALQGNDDDL